MAELNFLFPEMAHDVIESKTYLWFTRCLDVICTSIILFIFCYHIFVLYSHDADAPATKELSSRESTSRRKASVSVKSRKRSTDREYIAKWSTALHALSLLFIFFSFVTISVLLLNIWSVFPLSYSCDYIVYVLCFAFHLSKSTFYTICIVRLQVAFGISAYRYSLCQIYALLAFITVYTLVIICGTPSIVYGKFLEEPHLWCHVHIREEGAFVSIAVLCWIIMDMLISILLLFLFQKPIRHLLSVINHNKRLANLMVKYSVLTWISIVLSMASLLVYLWKHITTLIEINLPFMCICVVLMHVKYDNMFHRCCFICTRCCSALCASRKAAKKKAQPQKKHIELNTTDSKTVTGSDAKFNAMEKIAVHTPQESRQSTPYSTGTPVFPAINEESLELEIIA